MADGRWQMADEPYLIKVLSFSSLFCQVNKGEEGTRKKKKKVRRGVDREEGIEKKKKGRRGGGDLSLLNKGEKGMGKKMEEEERTEKKG